MIGYGESVTVHICATYIMGPVVIELNINVMHMYYVMSFTVCHWCLFVLFLVPYTFGLLL